MSKTKFINGQTPIESDFLNKIFGGDPASTNDAERLGHIHDGGTSDGHVAKIDLEDHVTGSVDGSRVKKATLNPAALKSFPDKEDAIQISDTSSGSERYFINVDPILEKIMNSTGEANIIQLSDGSGGFKYIDHAYITNITGTFGASLNLGNPSDSDYQSKINLYHGELNIFVDGSFKSSFRADTAQTSNINYSLPSSIGSANQVLGISSIYGGGSYADLEWITVSGSGGGASSSGARNTVQLSDGGGGFSSGDFKIRTVGSNDYVSINDNDTGISLEMRNKSRAIFENSHSQNLSLSMPDTVCGTSLSSVSSTIGSRFFGHNIELPIGDFSPGKAIYVRNIDTSSSTKNIQLGYSGVTFLDTACSYSGYTGTVLPSSSQYSGHDSTPMMLVPSELIQFDSTADIAPALAVFSSAGETVFHSGTGISAFSFNAPIVKIDGGLQVGGSGASSLKLYDSSNTEYVQISAANTITSSYSITLPSADGSANQILKTDGSGNLIWADDTLGDHIATQTLNMSGNDIDNAGDIHLGAGKGIILDSASGLNALASSSIPFDEGYFITAQFQTDLKLGSEAGNEGKIRYDASSNVFEIHDGSSWSTIGVTGTTGAPIGAEYIVLSSNSSLTNEKVFGVTAGDLVIATSSNSLTLSLDTDVLKSGDNISLLNNDSGFITSAAPINAEYLVLTSNATLNNEKVFGVTAGDLVFATSSNSLTLSLDASVLKTGDNISLLNNDAGYVTTAGAPTDVDYLVLSSSSELSNEKVFGVTAGDLVLATSSNSLTLSLDASVLKTGDNISLLNNDSGFLQNIVEDTTPQLGGFLDAQQNDLRDVAIIYFKDASNNVGGQIKNSGFGRSISILPGDGFSSDNFNEESAVYIGDNNTSNQARDEDGTSGISQLCSPSSRSILIGANALGNSSFFQVNGGLDSSGSSSAREGLELRVFESSADVGNVGIKSLHVNTTGSGISPTRSPSLRMYNAGGNYTSIKAASTALLTSNVDFVLPHEDGTSGQFLQTDGSGNLTFATVSSGGGAPTDAEYLVLSSDGTLSNEKVFGVTAGDLVLATSSNSLTLSLDASVLKTGDNISLLNNDAGYITTAGAPVSAEYLVLSADSALSNEKVFGVTAGDLVLATTSNSLTLSLNTDVLKSGDNISLLNNDAGYVTTSGAPTSAEYLVLSSNGELDNEKVFGVTAGDLVLATSSNSLTLSLDTDVLKSGDNISLLNNDSGFISALSEDGSPSLSATLSGNGNIISVGTGALTFSSDGAESIYGDGTFLRFKVGTLGTDELILSYQSLTPGDNLGMSLGSSAKAFSDLHSEDIYVRHDTSNAVRIQAPTLSASYTLTLPQNDGNASEFLQTDGNGVLTWASASSTVEIVNDTSPQLGGNLDANGFNVVLGTGNLVFDNANTYLNEEAGYINFYINSFKELMLNASELRPAFDNGLNLGASGQRFTNIYGGVINADTSVKFYDGTNTLTLNVPSGMTSSYNLDLPNQDGDNNGDALVTDGLGNLSFANPVSRKNIINLTRVDGTVKSGVWSYTMGPAVSSTETILVFNQDLITDTIADASTFNVVIADTSGWASGLSFSLMNVAQTVDANLIVQNTGSAAKFVELNPDNYGLSSGFVATPGRGGSFVIGKDGADSYVLKLSNL